ncbi:hypothetical protein [Streptomyces sp. NPDC048057]|uniref:hypothetical protein n=1 Tax=Streptomyces sp. NPDC048057 TaxID=3155628 RepID=UPI0033F4A157
MKRHFSGRPGRARAVAIGATALLCTGSALPAGATADGAGPAREAAALTGSAQLLRSSDDVVTFSFDAHLAARHDDDPLKATGTFRWSHRDSAGGGWAEAEVDCLVTGGKVAVVSGTVTRTDVARLKGVRVGITVHDTGGTDRLGYSWGSTGDPVAMGSVPACVGSAPFEKVRADTGDFRVLPWRPAF